MLTEKVYQNDLKLEKALAQIKSLNIKIDHMMDNVNGDRYAELTLMHDLEQELRDHGC